MYRIEFKAGWYYIYNNDRLKYCVHSFSDAIDIINSTI